MKFIPQQIEIQLWNPLRLNSRRNTCLKKDKRTWGVTQLWFLSSSFISHLHLASLNKSQRWRLLVERFYIFHYSSRANGVEKERNTWFPSALKSLSSQCAHFISPGHIKKETPFTSNCIWAAATTEAAATFDNPALGTGCTFRVWHQCQQLKRSWITADRDHSPVLQVQIQHIPQNTPESCWGRSQHWHFLAALVRVELWPLKGYCFRAWHDGRERLEGKVMNVGTGILLQYVGKWTWHLNFRSN